MDQFIKKFFFIENNFCSDVVAIWISFGIKQNIIWAQCNFCIICTKRYKQKGVVSNPRLGSKNMHFFNISKFEIIPEMYPNKWFKICPLPYYAVLSHPSNDIVSLFYSTRGFRAYIFFIHV